MGVRGTFATDVAQQFETMEPTTRLELVTCRLRIVGAEGTKHNLNHLQSRS